jgi:hypothetical protein
MQNKAMQKQYKSHTKAMQSNAVQKQFLNALTQLRVRVLRLAEILYHFEHALIWRAGRRLEGLFYLHCYCYVFSKRELSKVDLLWLKLLMLL